MPKCPECGEDYDPQYDECPACARRRRWRTAGAALLLAALIVAILLLSYCALRPAIEGDTESETTLIESEAPTGQPGSLTQNESWECQQRMRYALDNDRTDMKCPVTGEPYSYWHEGGGPFAMAGITCRIHGTLRSVGWQWGSP